MHQVLQSISTELDQLAAAIGAQIPNDEPFNVAQGNWSFPGLSRGEMIEAATSLADLIRERGNDSLGANEKRLNDYPRRLAYLRANMIQNMLGNAAVAVPSYLATLEGLRKAVLPALGSDQDTSLAASRAATRVRAMEARLSGIEPRAANLASMVDRIERAHLAADQLPADLEMLTEARAKIAEVRASAEADRDQVSVAIKQVVELEKGLRSSADEASAIVARCESAYAAATSQGLAAAFAERSKGLNGSMWAWVAGLVSALALGAYFGSRQLHDLADLMKSPSLNAAAAGLNLLLSIFSVGAPVWFAWLATKQIGQRFRLSEDYAFKAAVSRAYEGYRREASRIDKDMEAALLASALARLDEQPLRLVEHASHGSPWHELASSELVRDAVKSVPGFGRRVIESAKDALSKRQAGSAVTNGPTDSALANSPVEVVR
jgi:hypothetical protein